MEDRVQCWVMVGEWRVGYDVAWVMVGYDVG